VDAELGTGVTGSAEAFASVIVGATDLEGKAVVGDGATVGGTSDEVDEQAPSPSAAIIANVQTALLV
jgi:hypothetical protein